MSARYIKNWLDVPCVRYGGRRLFVAHDLYRRDLGERSRVNRRESPGWGRQPRTICATASPSRRDDTKNFASQKVSDVNETLGSEINADVSDGDDIDDVKDGKEAHSSIRLWRMGIGLQCSGYGTNYVNA